jgi:cellulose synthase operon protein B
MEEIVMPNKKNRNLISYFQLASLATPLRVVALLIIILVSEPSFAQPAKANVTVATQEQSLPGNRRVVTYSLKQLGSWSAVKLNGGEPNRTLAFNVRSDETVVAAKLIMGFDYSPILNADSHFKVFINDRISTIEPLPVGKGQGVVKEFALDPAPIKEVNELQLKLVLSLGGQCGGPLNPALWLTVGDTTKLELTVVPKTPMLLDLKGLPAPFLDKRETQLLKLPFVFSANPTMGTLRAAGAVSSYFSIQAGPRGAQFPVYLNELPPTNAVVFLNGNEGVAGYKGVQGASVVLQQHPNNPHAQVLLVNGSSDADIDRAARTIALMHHTLTGRGGAVASDFNPAPRKPYDAPNWIPTDRAMKFGELARLEELKVKGLTPDSIRINYRLPPDIFTWRTEGAPMQVKYRATRLPTHNYSNLSVGINNNFIDSIALNEKATNPSPLALNSSVKKSLQEMLMFLPPYAMGTKEQLQFTFTFDNIKIGECSPPDNLVAAIDAESTIDFSAFPKFTALPNLAYFAQIGFPFTKLADLSETVFVMPESAVAEEISLYLSMTGRLAESTGYPATHHEVISAADIKKYPNKDIIVIGSSQNQRLFADWKYNLPMYVENGVKRLREPNVNWRPTYRWEQKDIDEPNKPKSSVSLTGTSGLVTMMGFESPLTPSRSVVFLYADQATDFKRLTDLLTDSERTSSIQGDFVVVNEKTIQHTKASDTYYLGHIPWYSKFRWFLSDNPILVAFIALFLALLISAVMYRPLKLVSSKLLKKGK